MTTPAPPHPDAARHCSFRAPCPCGRLTWWASIRTDAATSSTPECACDPETETP